MTAISDLEIFARVVTAGNMSAAGREMGLSPAVVSKRVSHLERRLGARLFQRTTRQLTLTETGEGFYERIVNVLDRIEDAEAFVARRNLTPRGTLKVTAPTAFGRVHVAPYLAEFLQKYPDLKLELILEDHFSDIVRDGFDVAIRIGELQDSTLVAKRLAPNCRVICAAPSYIERMGAPRTLSEVSEHNCLTTTPQEVWRLEGPDGPASIRVSGNVRTNSSEVVRAGVLSGLGIALRSTWDIGNELKDGKLGVVLPQYYGSPRVALYAVYPCREFLPAKLKVFIDYFANLYGPQPYWDKGLKLSNDS